MSWKKASQALIFVLIVLAAVVAARIGTGRDAWGVIVTYWIVLTLKNTFDFVESRK